jgi:putative (di)nucleoside polyphosphate hydrolase
MSIDTTIEEKPYRLNVGVILFNKDGQVFMGERSDNPGSWQLPQGGIDNDEEYESAARRELFEETGIQNAEIIRMMESYLTYDFPIYLVDKDIYLMYKGQKQKWVAMRFLGEDKDIDLNCHHEKEFCSWKWVDLKDITETIVPFKKHIYDALIVEFKDISGL